MGKTAIEWCDEVLNYQRGCDPVSPGCAHCWAAATAARFSAPGDAFAGLARRKALPSGGSLAIWTDAPVTMLPEKMLDALSWRVPKRVFVNSVSDTFHADVPFEFIAAWWAFMACASHITFQIVTKRARRMREFFEWTRANGGPDHWLRCALDLCDRQIADGARDTDRWMKARATLPVRFKAVTARAELTRGLPDLMTLENVWLLVSTENQATYDERVPDLLQCPAMVRGISAEPLLGSIELGLGRWVRLPKRVVNRVRPETGDWPIAEPGIYRARAHHAGGLRVDGAVCDVRIGPDDYERMPDIDWAIIGGESGAGSRVNELRWTRDMLAQIDDHNGYRAGAGVTGYTAPFLKQLGGAALDREAGLVGRLYPLPPKSERRWIKYQLKDGHGGDEAEFPADLQGYRHFPIPRLPQAAAPAPTAAQPPRDQLGLAL